MCKDNSNTTIKVLLVGPIPPPFGGIPSYVKSLMNANINNIEYSLFNTAFPKWVAPFQGEGKRNYSSIFEISLWVGFKKVSYVLLSFFSLAWSIIIEKPQIVQVFTCTYWGYWRNWIYILIGRTFRRKTIFHLLGAIDLFYYEVGNIQRILLRKSFNSADCYLLQSPQLERWLKQFSGKTVIGLWNGIDFTKIQTKSSPPLRLITSFEGNVGITIGNLSLNKGIVDIISVLAKIKEEGIIIGWIFIGRGDLPFYSKFAEEKGVSQQIFFMGEVEEAIKWQMLHHSDFFCLPSYAEGQPISIIEAMACGLPIISTRVGSIPEMIQDGVTGFLIIPGDVFELKNAVLNLKNNPLLYESMGANSLRICHERHNIQFLYTALKELYINLTR